MLPLVPSFAAIFISALYCAWKRYHEPQTSAKKTVRERVARLLWAVATHDEVLA